MITSLPMYWRAENAGLWQRFWAHVQRHAPNLPDLTLPDELPDDWTDHWLDPNLGLSMTCSLPLRTALRDQVTYVGSLDFGLNCPPGYYYSVLIARPDIADSGRPLRLAYNASDSQSGWAARFDTGPDNPALTISETIRTGAHVASLVAVAEGTADVAYLDAVTWQLLRKYDPRAQRVIVHGQTTPTPGLPLITARGNDPAPLQRALHAAVRDFHPDDAMAMGGPLGFVVLPETAYLDQPVPDPPDAA